MGMCPGWVGDMGAEKQKDHWAQRVVAKGSNSTGAWLEAMLTGDGSRASAV